MNTMLMVVFLGIFALAAVGFLGRRGPVKNLGEWAVGGRKFGTWTMWFLQAGEIFTTFTFLGMGALVFAGGVAALYVPAYLVIAYIGSFYLAPLIWRIGKRRGYLTNADFLGDRFASPLLGRLTAIVGVVFLLPYLQLQITGMGILVELASGGKSSGAPAMVISVLLVLAFVLWAGLRGVAKVAYVKDALMIVVLALLVVVVPVHELGGFSGMFDQVAEIGPGLLTIHDGPFDHTWFLTSIVVSAIGAGCGAVPYMWPNIFAANGPVALRKNAALLPLYTACLLLPIIVGFVGVLQLKADANGNEVLLTMAGRALPDWLLGVVVVGGAATAMVPSAAMVLSLSSLVAQNLLPASTERGRLAVNHGAAVVICGLSLLLALGRPDALANLLLLTFSGLAQLVPGNMLGLLRRRPCGGGPVIWGIAAGVAVVTWITLAEVPTGNVNAGLIGLAANLTVLGAGILLGRLRGSRVPERSAEPAEASGTTDRQADQPPAR